MKLTGCVPKKHQGMRDKICSVRKFEEYFLYGIQFQEPGCLRVKQLSDEVHSEKNNCEISTVDIPSEKDAYVVGHIAGTRVVFFIDSGAQVKHKNAR